MKTKITRLLFSAVLMMCCTVSAWAGLGTPPDDEIWYTTTEGQVCAPSLNNVFGATIQSNTYVDGKGVIKFSGNVTSIGERAFRYCSGLTSVIIPASVTSIGNNAFHHCSGLTSVIIPASVTSIGDFAFCNCSGLTSVIIPASVTSIGDFAFYNNENLCDVLFLGNGDITLGDHSFYKRATIYVADPANFSGTWCDCPVKAWRSGEGDGTEDNPYQIATLDNLLWFANHVNAGNVSACAELTADITMNAGVLDSDGNLNIGTYMEWTPMGSNEKSFTGTFNGNGHTISGLYVNDASKNYVGLFGMTNGSAHIYDLGIKDCYFSGNNWVSGICGNLHSGIIENCWNGATVISNSTDNAACCAGGIAASCWTEASVNGCYNIGKVSAKFENQCGGICGAVDGSVKNCVTLDVGYSGYGYKGGSANIENVYIKDASDFPSGKVCWILNGNQRSANWRQQLGTDDYPTVTGGYIVYNDDTGYHNETMCEKGENHLHDFESVSKTQPGGTPISYWHCKGCAKNYRYDDKTTELPETECTMPSAGDGSKESPYQIATLANLLWFADHVNSGNPSACAILMADITMNTGVLNSSGNLSNGYFFEWTPIGGQNAKDYSGEFNGNGHTISGLCFNSDSRNNVGLFGKAVNNAHIHDLGVSDSYFYGKDHVGGICGDFASGKIENCWNGATIYARDWNAGGISGSCWKYASIRDCYNIGKIKSCGNGNQSYGGICGAVYENTDVDYTISNCYTLQGKCAKVYGSLEENCPASKINHSFVKNDDAFASGEVCYQLNHGVTDDSQKWYQTLESDLSPVLNNSRGVIFYGYDGDVLKYSNTKISVGAIHRNICDATCTVGYTMECWEDTRSRRFYAEEACATELNAAYVVTYSPVKTASEYDCNLAAWPWKMKDESVTYDGVTFINALVKRYSDAASYYYGEYVWFKVKDTTARNARLKWHLNKNTFDGELYYKINDGNETKIDISGNMWVQDLPDLKQDDIVTVYYRITSMWDISLNSPLIWTMSLEYCSEHNLEHNSATMPTCTENGNYENWYCTKCGTHFKDELYRERWANDNGWIVPKANKNEIWYTSTNNQIINPYKTTVFGASITGNKYEHGFGVIAFDGDVTSIGNYAFDGYMSEAIRDLQAISIPSSVTSIGEGAFDDCSSLQSINIPSAVTSIGKSAFRDCASLQSINIPSGVTSIGENAFLNCSNMKSVTFHSVPYIDKYAFNTFTGRLNIENKVLDLTDSDKPYIGTSLNNYPEGGFTKARYHRTLEEGKWGTIVLPFKPSAESTAGLKFYVLQSVKIEDTENGKLTFMKVDAPEAGIPYLFKNESESADFTLTAETPSSIVLTTQEIGGDFKMKGSFQQTSLNTTDNPNDNLYYLKDNGFYHANGKINIAPFRAYIEGSGATLAKSFMLVISDNSNDVTAIPGIMDRDGNIDETEAIYDLNGRKLSAPVKGQVNIIRLKSGKTIKRMF